jgi:anaphase-promoting complex subunit 2
MGTDSSVEDVIHALQSCAKTVVAVVKGNVSGGSGLEVILACDYRVVLSTCELGGETDMSETFLSQRVMHGSRRRVKKESAMTKLLNGESIPATEAKHIGLVDEVISPDEPDLLLCVGTQIALKHGKRVHYAREGSTKRLLYYIPEQFLLLRSSQLFNLIRDFPDSQPALNELKIALSLTCQLDFVIASIKHQLADRLLIPGAHTEDVLEMYLRTYKVVSFLFPKNSMEIFVKIATPVIQHLQRRPDSVKCIVGALLDNERDSMETDQYETDTISLLIGVYGGQESFLAEYKDMLAGRLISIGSFDIDRELASLDLMKSKFGDAALGNCSVMIKDVVESRKLNGKIKSQLTNAKFPPSQLTMMVKSGHFWPSKSFGKEGDDDGEAGGGLEAFSFLPSETQNLMREYERIYTQLKPTQRVEWRRAEGVMTISITQKNGRETEFRLSPIFVEILSLFEKISLPVSASAVMSASMVPSVTLSLEAIATAVKLPVESVRPVVQFWVAKGILREIEINKFVLNE